MFGSIVTNIGHDSTFLARKSLVVVEIRMAYFLALIRTPLNLLHASVLVLKFFMAPMAVLSMARVPAYVKYSMVSLTVHDPGGYWWPPTYSTWTPTIVSFSFPISLIVA